jgi:uncharacterized protein (TIGR03435 family)
MRFIVLALTLSQTAIQTPQAKHPEFEVASIRPVEDDGHHSSNRDNATYRTHNLSLKRLIARAYDVEENQVFGGPPWLDTEGFDINARIPDEFVKDPARDTVPQMLQNLLATRFQLVVHRETRQGSGFLLTVAKKGSKMEPAKKDDPNSHFRGRTNSLAAENATTEAFARYLSRTREIGGLVIDKTGLQGGYNFELEWSSDPSDGRPSIFTAIQEKLGLKLDSAKVPFEAIVVDSAQKPEAN